MPQPMRDKFSVFTGTAQLKGRPAHLVGIALVAAAWVELEKALAYLMSYTLYFSSHEHKAESTAATALATLESLAARIAVVQALLRPRVPPEMLEEFIREIAPEIRRRAGERATIVHGHWAVSPEYPNDIVLITNPNFDEVRYSIKDFDDIVARIEATHSKLFAFCQRIEAHTC